MKAKLALSLSSLLGSLVVLECVLRIFHITPNDLRAMEYTHNIYSLEDHGRGQPPAVFFPNRMSHQVYYKCLATKCTEDKRVEWRTNSFGMRDRERSLTKGKNTTRIIVLGDSFTAGVGVAAEETYPQQLEKLLNSRHDGRPQFEVWNTAVSGFSTFDEWHYLMKYGLRFRPDLIVVGLYLNDSVPWGPFSNPKTNPELLDSPRIRKFQLSYRPMIKNQLTGNIKSTWTFRHSLYISNWVHAAMVVWRTNPATIRLYRFWWSEDNWIGMGHFKEALEGLSRLQRERNIPVLILVWPKLDWLDGNYPFDDVHDKIRSLCAKYGLASVDLLPLLRGRKPSSLWVHPTDHHPNAWAHRLAATTLMGRLSNDPLFKTHLNIPLTLPPTPAADVR